MTTPFMAMMSNTVQKPGLDIVKESKLVLPGLISTEVAVRDVEISAEKTGRDKTCS